MDVNSLRPILKKKPKMQDPPRYPEIINSYEREAIDLFNVSLQKMMVEISKEMISLTK